MTTQTHLIDPRPRYVTLGDVEFLEIDYAAKYLEGATDTSATLAAFDSDVELGAIPQVSVGTALTTGIVVFRVEPTEVGTFHAIAQISTAEGRKKSWGVQVIVGIDTPLP
jgi:hypothetical protein